MPDATTAILIEEAAALRRSPPLDVVPFQPWHLEWLNVQESQMALSPLLTLEYGRALAAAGPCYSAFAGSRVIACAGVVQFWAGRAQVWSLLSEAMPQYRKSIHEAVKTFLDGYHVRRLECTVDPRSEVSYRWAKRLGFVYEGTLRAYTPGGDTLYMLVRLQP